MLDQELLHGLLIGHQRLQKYPLLRLSMVHMEQKTYLKKKYNSVMVKGDYVIAISKFIKMHIKKEYNKVDNVFVIPRGINENIFSPDKVTAERIISAAKK